MWNNVGITSILNCKLNNAEALLPTQGQEVSTDCLCRLHLTAERWKIVWSVKEWLVASSRPPAVIGFLDHNYRYKSGTTQIPHDAGLAFLPRVES